MIYIAVRTDKPEAELYILNDGVVGDKIVWLAHRQLLETINTTFEELLKKQDLKAQDINGILFYAGPGSFTGLRIGASFANALSAGLKVPIVACEGVDWLQIGVTLLQKQQNYDYIAPKYGSPAHITTSK